MANKANKPKPTVAITGASGFLGSRLVEHFSGLGWQVKALVRNPGKHKNTGHVQYLAYDITGQMDATVLQDCDYLVHAAFIKQGNVADAFAANLKGAEAILAASRKNRIKRNIFISSVSTHDKATSTYGLQKLAIEKLFDRPQDLSIRSGLIIGDGGLVRQMALFMRSKHLVPLIGGGRQPLQTIAVYDLVRVVEKALRTDISGIITVATPKVYPYKDFYAALGRRLHVRFLYVPLPYIMMQTIIRTLQLLPIPLGVNEDNLIGLKNLRAAETAADLRKLDITVDDLETALKKTTIQ